MKVSKWRASPGKGWSVHFISTGMTSSVISITVLHIYRFNMHRHIHKGIPLSSDYWVTGKARLRFHPLSYRSNTVHYPIFIQKIGYPFVMRPHLFIEDGGSHKRTVFVTYILPEMRKVEFRLGFEYGLHRLE